MCVCLLGRVHRIHTHAFLRKVNRHKLSPLLGMNFYLCYLSETAFCYGTASAELTNTAHGGCIEWSWMFLSLRPRLHCHYSKTAPFNLQEKNTHTHSTQCLYPNLNLQVYLNINIFRNNVKYREIFDLHWWKKNVFLSSLRLCVSLCSVCSRVLSPPSCVFIGDGPRQQRGCNGDLLFSSAE